MKPDLFLADLERKPEVLRALARRLRDEDPWAFLDGRPERVLLLGMGSSAYAGGVAAARLRARGLTAVCELASSDLLPAWGDGTLVVAVSATGGSRETLDALARLSGGETVVALTNTDGSAVGSAAGHTVAMHAEPEDGGVACRSFQHTLVQLLALERHLVGEPLAPLADDADRAADASEHLLTTVDDWLPEVTDLLAGPDGTHLAAPARRFSSAQQGALMLREGPRRQAVGCEAGDWAHVDVYLRTPTTGCSPSRGRRGTTASWSGPGRGARRWWRSAATSLTPGRRSATRTTTSTTSGCSPRRWCPSWSPPASGARASSPCGCSVIDAMFLPSTPKAVDLTPLRNTKFRTDPYPAR